MISSSKQVSLQLRPLRFPNQSQKALVNLVGQIARLHTPPLLLEGAPRALARDAAARPRRQQERRGRRHPLAFGVELRLDLLLRLRLPLVVAFTRVPHLLVIRGSPGQERP